MIATIVTVITQNIDIVPEHWGLPADVSVAEVEAEIKALYGTGEGFEQIMADDDAIWSTEVKINA